MLEDVSTGLGFWSSWAAQTDVVMTTIGTTYTSNTWCTLMVPVPVSSFVDPLGVFVKRCPRFPQCSVCQRCHTPRALLPGAPGYRSVGAAGVRSGAWTITNQGERTRGTRAAAEPEPWKLEASFATVNYIRFIINPMTIPNRNAAIILTMRNVSTSRRVAGRSSWFIGLRGSFASVEHLPTLRRIACIGKELSRTRCRPRTPSDRTRLSQRAGTSHPSPGRTSTSIGRPRRRISIVPCSQGRRRSPACNSRT